MYLKAFFWLLVVFLISTLGLAGVGFWKLYDIDMWCLIGTLGIYVGMIVALVILAIKVLYFTKVELNNLKAKIEDVVSKTVAYFQDLSTKPMELLKVVIKVLNALKKK